MPVGLEEAHPGPLPGAEGAGRTTLPGFRFRTVGVILACVLAGLWAGRTGHAQEPGAPLPGTKPLTMTGDIASDLVAGADRFLLKQIDEVGGQAGELLEAGFLVGAGVSRLRSSPTASGWRTSWGCEMRGCRPGSEVPDGAGGAPRLPAVHGRAIGSRSALAGVRRCDRRRARAATEDRVCRLPHSGHRDPGRRPDARAACRPGAGRAARVAGGPPAGRERLPRDRAGSDRSHGRGAQRPGQADQPRVHLSLGLRAGPAPDRLRGSEGAGPGRRAESETTRATRHQDRRSSATAKGARSPCMRRRSTRGSTPSASAAISATATTSGGSRSIAMSSGCWSSSATPRSPA